MTGKGVSLMTARQRTVLMIECDPRYFRKPVTVKTRLAEQIGCRMHPQTYRRIIRDPSFRETFIEIRRQLVSLYLGRILDASIETALIPNRSGFRDRKMLLSLLTQHRPLEEGDAVGVPSSDYDHGRLSRAKAAAQEMRRRLQDENSRR